MITRTLEILHINGVLKKSYLALCFRDKSSPQTTCNLPGQSLVTGDSIFTKDSQLNIKSHFFLYTCVTTWKVIKTSTLTCCLQLLSKLTTLNVCCNWVSTQEMGWCHLIQSLIMCRFSKRVPRRDPSYISILNHEPSLQDLLNTWVLSLNRISTEDSLQYVNSSINNVDYYFTTTTVFYNKILSKIVLRRRSWTYYYINSKVNVHSKGIKVSAQDRHFCRRRMSLWN